MKLLSPARCSLRATKCFSLWQQSWKPRDALYRSRLLNHTVCRGITTYSTPTDRFRETLRKAQKQNPVLLPVLLVAALGSVSLLGLMAYDELTRVTPEYSSYPTAVEQRLRMALHFTHVDPNPSEAAKHFGEALKAADESGMAPFSKEVMGIRIRCAEMLERFGHVQASVEVLNGIVKDCEVKIDELNRGTQDEDKSTLVELRRSLLKTIIQIRVKSAALYESDYLQDPATAKKTLSDAVALLVKETKDPQTNGFSEDNAAGMSLEEIASMLSQMGDLYATTGEEANAVQVYMLTLQPLRAACNGTRSCKEVQILSNIASTMDIAMKKPGATINGKPATKASLEAARRATLKWVDQAIATAEVVKTEDRDEICELGLLSAQMTKADLLLENGQKLQAREAFRNLIPILREKGLTHLIKVAEQGFQRAST